MAPEVEVTTPAAVKLDVKFANGKSVLVEKGGKAKAILTGDEVGYVLAQLEAARKEARKAGERDSDCDGGGVKVLDEGYGVVPVGSKKHRSLHPDEYVEGIHKSDKKALKAAADAEAADKKAGKPHGK